MRSPREIAFRLKQELRNLRLLAIPPRLDPEVASALPILPAAEFVADALRATPFAAEVVQTANQIVSGRLPLLGLTIETGTEIEWRRDYLNQISSKPHYFRLIPYLDATRVGDHKVIWELNRQQHLVLLAQAFLFTRRQIYLDTIFDQLQSWWVQNPYQRGINWTSALEVAFRAFSWMWVYHFVGRNMPSNIRSRFLESLYQHGRHIENNLSIYFSPNTHLLGEAMVLHALGKLCSTFPRAGHWAALGARTVIEQMRRQVRPDGSHFEQSTYYHVYALDMFLFHGVLINPSDEYRATLGRMADFLDSLMGPDRNLPFIGDDDGGRFFHPYGPRAQFGRATLATCATLLERDKWRFDTCDLFPQCAWWLGRTEGSGVRASASQLFADAGLSVFEHASNRVIFDAGPFGPGAAGHSHSDSLSVVAAARESEVLSDSGTYIYVGDPKWRNAFRGSGAHNTIRVDRRDQATPLNPFRWADPPAVRIVSWESHVVEDTALGECSYNGIVHRRLLRFRKPNVLFVLDSIAGPGGTHELEQFWHLASAKARNRLFLGSHADEEECWHSPVFGVKELRPCVVVRRTTTLPAHFAAALVLDGNGTLAIEEQGAAAVFELSEVQGTRTFTIDWPLQA